MDSIEKISVEVEGLMEYFADRKFDMQLAASVTTSLIGNLLLQVKEQDEREFQLLKEEILKGLQSVGIDMNDDYRGGLN